MSPAPQRMARDEVTVHGFRSTFRDWAAEQTSFPHETCEHALAHRISDKAEAAYRRGDQFDKRRKLMEAWQAFAESKPMANVVPLKR
jgi:integrase